MSTAAAEIREAAATRILVLDGASGSELQTLRLSDAEMSGDRFHDHGRSLAGDHDILVLTRPDAVLDLHRRYLAAGADIITTNTFSSTSVAQREYGLDAPQVIREINVAAAQLARRAATEATARD